MPTSQSPASGLGAAVSLAAADALHAANAVGASTPTALWSDAAGTALRKPSGDLVSTGAYLGEFAWTARPDPTTAPAYSRFLCTDAALMIEFIRSIDATQWLPLGTALLGSGALGPHTGTTAETVFWTYSVPANLLPGRRLFFNCWYNKTGTAGTLGISLKYASTYVVSKGGLSSTVTGAMQGMVSFGSSTQSHPRTNFLDLGFETTSGAAGAGTVNTGTAQNLTLALTLSNAADSVTIADFSVQLMR
jgi:hypothetical protein